MKRTWSPPTEVKRWRFVRVDGGRLRPLFRCSRIRVTIE